MIAYLDRGHAFAYRLDHATAFVAENDRHGHRKIALHHMQVTVADACGLHTHRDLALLWRQNAHLFDAQGFLRFIQNGGSSECGHGNNVRESRSLGKSFVTRVVLKGSLPVLVELHPQLCL